MFNSQPISSLGQMADASLRTLPPAGLVVVIGLLVGGLLMWAFGGRLVKPMYGFLFGIVGAVAGLFVPASMGLGINPYVGIGVGAVVGALAGILFFRLSMAAALASAGAVLAPTVAVAAMWFNSPAPAGTSNEGSALAESDLFLTGVPREPGAEGETARLPWFLDSLGPGSPEATDAALGLMSDDPAVEEAIDAAVALARSAADRLRAFAGELLDEGRAAWSGVPERQRLILALAAAIGALGGFVLGMSFPKKVAAVGSAFLGAGVWAPTAARIMTDFSLPGAGSLPATARGWLALWLILAAIGMALQWTVLSPKADKPTRAE